MSKKILPFELAEGINLELYEGCKNFRCIDWYYSFSFRKKMLKLVEHSHKKMSEEEIRKFRNDLNFCYGLLVQPLENYDNVKIDELIGKTISPATGLDVYYEWLDLKKYSCLEEYKDVISTGECPKDAPDGFEEEFNSAIDKPLEELKSTNISNYFEHHFHRALVMIELDAPDRLLELQFKEYLSKYRERLGLGTRDKMFAEKDFKKWYEKQLLFYLDLEIFGKFSGVSATYHQIGLVLFPDEYDVSLSERVRNVVKKEAEKMLETHNLSALHRQANQEVYSKG